MGDGKWVTVTQWWDKGTLPVRALELGSGSVLRCTNEHQLFVLPRRAQRALRDRDEVIECTADQVEEGDQLLTPLPLTLGARRMNPDDAWLLGVFVADGWIKYDDRRERHCPLLVSIAGKDGHPKEAQKRRVEAIAQAKGWRTKMTSRWVEFWPDETWMELFVSCGRTALNKHLPFLDVDRETATALLDGLSADASKNSHGGGITYGTISPTLALQIRVLLAATGIRSGIRRVDEHGGFGKNPIYRVGARQPGRYEFVGVRDVQPEDGDEHVYDIAVDGHRFYLPEHDIVVHNCDDQVIFLGSMLAAVGYEPELVVMQAKGASDYSHILMRVPLPKTGSDGGTVQGLGNAIVLDPTMAEKFPPGWEPPGLTECLSYGRPAGMCMKAKSYKIPV